MGIVLRTTLLRKEQHTQRNYPQHVLTKYAELSAVLSVDVAVDYISVTM